MNDKGRYDIIIIGAGLYGLYAALKCAQKGRSVAVIEQDERPFMRATYINQARVHQGYHYPRSLATASKSANYFRRFVDDFGFCVNGDFTKIYATSSRYSWTSSSQFESFCKAAGIPCEPVHPNRFFKPGMCDGAFLAQEYTYDAMMLRDWMLDEIAKTGNVEINCLARVSAIHKSGGAFSVDVIHDGKTISCETGFLLNASYASSNQILQMAGFDGLNLKYELCETTLCEPGDELRPYGITVMDGPFFSIMPFGKTGLHSLTSVTFTPHETSYSETPTFDCQQRSGGYCSPKSLGNCDICQAKPTSAYPYMSGLARKYLLDKFEFSYVKGLYSMKPILMASEVDDSRPTVVRRLSSNPTFVSILSGKINTIYDLDEELDIG